LSQICKRQSAKSFAASPSHRSKGDFRVQRPQAASPHLAASFNPSYHLKGRHRTQVSFEVNEDRVSPGVLDIHFRTPSVWPALSGASTGTNVRRRRLNPQDFLDYEMPLPSRKTQMILKEVRAETDALKLLQAETAAELDAMLPSILDRAFDGDL
jgi:hypothetical protein